ncbi:putative F-box protein At1g65770 [Juglans microcarpa x Juglans regia]|uniref:putative F-box protein At1g65770 n=1 Tax=Juglans microcarpa x Juglans regia TaxID=2249226 RepID=UPI001B7EF6D1|nr:putative F-box protein At1g65770 [Juglans microcarpa x Juglans regia]
MNFPRNKFFTQSYLVESLGGLLLVDRIVGYFVNSEGIAVDEYDLLIHEDTQPLVCPYRTKLFNVYELDHKQETWKKVESLGDRVIFVGGNYSMSLSIHDLEGCESNTIYFSDDNWNQVDEDYMYGGHDFGMHVQVDRWKF